MTTTAVNMRPSDLILQQLRPSSRGKTSYTSMNEWLSLPGRTIPESRQVYRDMNDWKDIPTHEHAVKKVEAVAKEECTTAAEPRTHTREGFQKKYDNLTNQIAYRWPNPGSPRNREGGIGGTWRHIKEVLCHGGSRTVFVDGLVSVYDSQKFTDRLQAHLDARPQAKPLYKQLPPSQITTTHRASFNAYPVLPAVPSAKAPNQLRHLGRYPNERLGHYDKM